MVCTIVFFFGFRNQQFFQHFFQQFNCWKKTRFWELISVEIFWSESRQFSTKIDAYTTPWSRAAEIFGKYYLVKQFLMNSEVNFPFWNLMIPDFPRKIVKFSSRNLVFLFNSFFNNSTVFTVDFFKTKTVEFNS